MERVFIMLPIVGGVSIVMAPGIISMMVPMAMSPIPAPITVPSICTSGATWLRFVLVRGVGRVNSCQSHAGDKKKHATSLPNCFSRSVGCGGAEAAMSLGRGGPERGQRFRTGCLGLGLFLEHRPRRK